MPIPESQLETWSHQGSITQSSNTYNSIKNILEANTTPYSGRNFKVFLQGSYGNDTNIYSESDVDIVITLDDCYYADIDNLSAEEKTAYEQSFIGASYTLSTFKQDVVSVLNDTYGTAVNVGAKAVSIEANGSRRKSDIIISCQFRRYTRFRSIADSRFIEGMCFFNSNGERIANYPKQHSVNLTGKHQLSTRRLKPMARVLKNIRSKLVAEGLIKNGTAPSYYIEGLLYNVPNSKFTDFYQDNLCNIINWYLQEAQKTNLFCANEQYYLLRDGSHTCWKPSDCEDFISAIVGLWNNW